MGFALYCHHQRCSQRGVGSCSACLKYLGCFLGLLDFIDCIGGVWICIQPKLSSCFSYCLALTAAWALSPCFALGCPGVWGIQSGYMYKLSVAGLSSAAPFSHCGFETLIQGSEIQCFPPLDPRRAFRSVLRAPRTFSPLNAAIIFFSSTNRGVGGDATAG